MLIAQPHNEPVGWVEQRETQKYSGIYPAFTPAVQDAEASIAVFPRRGEQ